MHIASLQLTSPLWELPFYMGSYYVTCHLAEVTFPPLPQPIKTGTQFSKPGGYKAELNKE